MQWRLQPETFTEQMGEPNRAALRSLVESGNPPGLLGYVDGRPVAWCSVARRDEYAALEPVWGPAPGEAVDPSVWAVACFFVAEPFRRQGVMRPLLEAAVAFARDRGAKAVEGYPVEPAGELSDPLGFTGVASVFRKVGFAEVGRSAGHQPIMRLPLKES